MVSLQIGPPELQRWYILVVSSLASAIQCNTWFTFSSVPTKVEQYYHLKHSADGDVNGVIDLLLNWGPIMAFPSIPLTAYILLFPRRGLMYSVKLSVSLVFFGCLIRCIPTILASIDNNYIINNSFWNTLIFLHVGQILNAIAGVIIMSVPSKLSVIWFPETERKFATGCISIAGSLGSSFSFLCGPYLVENSNDIPWMLYVDLFLAFIPFICILLHFPSSPTKLPSNAAKYALLSIPFPLHQTSQNNVNNININDPLIHLMDEDIKKIDDSKPIAIAMKANMSNFWNEIKNISVSKSTLLMVLIGGFQSGISSAYDGVTQDMLSPLGFGDKAIGSIGFIQTGMNMVGALIMGWISDKYFSKKIKFTLYVLFGWSITILLVLLFILPSPWNSDSLILDYIDNDSIIYKMIIVTTFMAMLGFLSGALLPLFYELTSEVAYPYGISEGTSSTLLVLIINATCLIFVGIGTWVGTKYETISSVVVYTICVLLLFFVQETYQRS